MQLFLIFNFQDLCQVCDTHFNLVEMRSLFCPGYDISGLMKWFSCGIFLDIFIFLLIPLGRLLSWFLPLCILSFSFFLHIVLWFLVSMLKSICTKPLIVCGSIEQTFQYCYITVTRLYLFFYFRLRC